MKQVIIACLLVATLALSGCSQPETPKTETPAAKPSATPAPAAASGELSKATELLERAHGEVQEKNYRGALDLIDEARQELTAAINNLSAPAKGKPDKVKTGLEQASTSLDAARALVEKRDPAAEKKLAPIIPQISKLAEQVQSLKR